MEQAARPFPKVFVVIPTFNRRGPLEACVRSLHDQTVSVTIIVADAGSQDGTREMLARDARLIRVEGDPSLWWTGSTNLGLDEALRRAGPSDYVLCLNDDTQVGPDYVEQLLRVAAKGARRLVGSLAVDAAAPERIVDGGVRLNWLTAKLRSQNAGRRRTELPADLELTVDVLPGRGTLIPVRAFLELGKFADQLPHYGADYEFAARCARAGYELIVTYGAVVHSRTDLTGMHRARRRLSLKEAHAYFLTRRSACNLRDRFVFAWLTRRSPWQAIVFFLASAGRITWRYVRNHEPDAAAG